MQDSQVKEAELSVPMNEMSVQQIKQFIKKEFTAEVAEKFEGKLVIHSRHFNAPSFFKCALNLFFIRVNCRLTYGLY